MLLLSLLDKASILQRDGVIIASSAFVDFYSLVFAIIIPLLAANVIAECPVDIN